VSSSSLASSVAFSSTGSFLTASCSFLNKAAFVRILDRLIKSRLINVLRSAEPAEIRRFNSFLIIFFAYFFARAVGVVKIDSLDEDDDGRGSGCQASTIMICCRFLLLITTRKGRASSISEIIIGSA
jgi:hypothetical protein